jgi:hypothetical protein
MTLLSILAKLLERSPRRAAEGGGPPPASAPRHHRSSGRLEPDAKPQLANLRFPVLPPLL